MGPTDGDAQAGNTNAEAAPVLVTRMFRSFPAFVEEYASRVALTGAFISAVEPLPVQTTVHVDFQLRDGFRLFHGVGEVEWVRPVSTDPALPTGMGVRFLGLDDKGRDLMLRMLEEHVKGGGQPFDLEPLPPGASTDLDAVPRPGEDISAQDDLDHDFAPEATMIAPSMMVREPPVSEIIDVSFARRPPRAASPADVRTATAEAEPPPEITFEPEPEITLEPEPEITLEAEPEITFEADPEITFEAEPEITFEPEPTPEIEDLALPTTFALTDLPELEPLDLPTSAPAFDDDALPDSDDLFDLPEGFDLTGSADPVTEGDEPSLSVFEDLGPAPQDANAATDDTFEPPWQSELPDIPEEFLEQEESVGGNELAQIAEAAEAASRVELPIEPAFEDGLDEPLFDPPPAEASPVVQPARDAPAETVLVDADTLAEAARLDVMPALPTIDFSDEVESAWPDLTPPSITPPDLERPPATDPVFETPAAAAPTPGFALPIIPPPAPAERLGIEPTVDEAGEPLHGPNGASEAAPAPYWLDETGSAMRKPNPWPKRLTIGLVFVLMTAALWFFRDRLLPADDAPSLATTASTPVASTAPPTAGTAGTTAPSTGNTETPASARRDPAPSAPVETADAGATDSITTAGTTASEPSPSTASPAPRLPPATLVTGIDWEETDNGTLLVISLDGVLTANRLTASELGGPSPRVLIKVRGIEAPYASTLLQVGDRAVRRVRTGYHPSPRGNELHIVVDLASSNAHLVGEPLPGPDGRVEVLIAP